MNRSILDQTPLSCFPYASVNTTNPRSVIEDSLYLNREQISTTGRPAFQGGEGARVDLESALRPCIQRMPAGDKDSIRSKPIPWALSSTPMHYLWQPASDLSRDLHYSTRIAQINCKQGPACQTRSFT